MVQDSIENNVPLLESDEVVRSLIKLRDETYAKFETLDTDARVLFWKMNSCLYRGYPLRDAVEKAPPEKG